MNADEFSTIIATLVTNGFQIYKVDRASPGNIIVNVYKFDKLGAEIKYSILFSEDLQENTIIESLLKSSNSYGSYPIYVNDHFNISECPSYSKKKLFDSLGGIVNTGLLIIPTLPSILDELGHNKLPVGLTGEPDDLHEIYACECFQFLLSSPARRYGKDRIFEELPDGIVLGKNFMILIDSKAYTNGFSFSADDIKRFASYVDDFNNRYSQFFGRIISFVVISGHFNDSEESILSRSDSLYQKCGCRLSCITSIQMGNIVQRLQRNPEYRLSINWKNILSQLIISNKNIETEIKRISKDNLY